MQKQQALDTLQEISAGAIYLMGGSFILGSLFTLLLLILLDVMRKAKHKRTKS